MEPTGIVPQVDVEPGLSGRATLVVGEHDTAIALGSGSVPVLATPRVVALCEAATCAALEGRLSEGSTSVGVRVSLDHLRPTPVGGEVSAIATVAEVAGRRITFEVRAEDASGSIATGLVERVVVDVTRFLSSL